MFLQKLFIQHFCVFYIEVPTLKKSQSGGEGHLSFFSKIELIENCVFVAPFPFTRLGVKAEQVFSFLKV